MTRRRFHSETCGAIAQRVKTTNRKSFVTFKLDHCRNLATFAIVTVISIALATLSWRYLEEPISRTKSRVPYPVPA